MIDVSNNTAGRTGMEELELENELNTSETASTASAGTPYVRTPKKRITADPINDYAQAGVDVDAYTHESDFTADAGRMSGKGYRRSRSEMKQLKRNLQYGQYLEIPKGRRDIFAKRERASRVKSLLAAIIVIALVIAAGYFVFMWLKDNLFIL